MMGLFALIVVALIAFVVLEKALTTEAPHSVKEVGRTKCPDCDEWSSNSDWTYKPTDNDKNPVVTLICPKCSAESNWIFGPGILLHVPKEAQDGHEDADRKDQ